MRFSDLLVAYRVQELISAISSKLRLLFIRTSTGVFRPERLSSIIRIVLSKIFDKNFNQQVLNKINQDSNFFHKIIAYLHKAEKEFVQNNKKTDFKTFYDYIEKSAIIEQQEIEQIDWETYFNNDSSISKTLELIKLSQMMQESQFNRDSSEPEP